MVFTVAAVVSAVVGSVASFVVAMVATNNRHIPSSAKKKMGPKTLKAYGRCSPRHQQRLRKQQREREAAASLAEASPRAMNMEVDGEATPAAAAAAAPAASAGSQHGQHFSFSGIGSPQPSPQYQLHAQLPFGTPHGNGNGNGNPSGMGLGTGGPVCQLFPSSPRIDSAGMPGAVGQPPQPVDLGRTANSSTAQYPPFTTTPTLGRPPRHGAQSPAHSAMSSLTGVLSTGSNIDPSLGKASVARTHADKDIMKGLLEYEQGSEERMIEARKDTRDSILKALREGGKSERDGLSQEAEKVRAHDDKQWGHHLSCLKEKGNLVKIAKDSGW